jgi:phosphohistidine phosphatase
MRRSLRGATLRDVTDRRLIVMRHAKAEPFAASDRERRLTDRGEAEAHSVGEHLKARGTSADYAVVSSAVRTRQSWEAVVETSGMVDVEVSFDDAVFTGSPDVVMEALRSAPADARTVMFVGHNPTAAYLCHLLDDGSGDTAAVSQLLRGFPPAAVAVLDVSVPWAELGPETGRVVDYYVGAS